MYAFLPKYKKFAIFSFYLICIIFLLKKFSCQPYFRDDGENQQRNVGKSIPTTEMTSLSIFQELFFFSERKKIDGNIFFRRISTTNIFFLFFLTDFKWLLPFLGKDFFFIFGNYEDTWWLVRYRIGLLSLAMNYRLKTWFHVSKTISEQELGRLLNSTPPKCLLRNFHTTKKKNPKSVKIFKLLVCINVCALTWTSL